MINIDAGFGEGGGQLFRTALALSAVSSTPVRIHHIRARRQPSGLQPQHLTAAAALARITTADLTGARPGSDEVTFVPGPVRAGSYEFDVGTAGSTTLILQTILLPLACADQASELTLTGGTHVPWSPPANYLHAVFFPVLAHMGLTVQFETIRWGFYPKGGGLVRLIVQPSAGLAPLSLVRRTGRESIRGVSTVARLARSIAERQRSQAIARLKERGWTADIDVEQVDSDGAGSCVFLGLQGGGARAGATGLGARGRPAEAVADGAVDELLAFLDTEAGCDPHLADQLILPMALAAGTSRLTTSTITGHLLSAIELVREFLGCPVQVSGKVGEAGSVTLEGVGRMQPSRMHNPEPTLPSRQDGHAEIRQPAVARAGSGMGLEGIVRKPNAGDGPAIQRLLAHFARKGELLPRTLNEVYRNLRDFFIAEVAGEVVGVCALSLYWEDLSEIRSLAVHESQGGRGLGSALVRACLEEAATLGVGRTFALTYRPTFFERLGFHVIDKRELPQKIWKDCLQCAKFNCCDEVALIRDLSSVTSGADTVTDTQWAPPTVK